LSKVYTAQEIEQIMSLMQSTLSLNEPTRINGETEDAEFGDFLEDPSPTPEEALINDDRRDKLMFYLNSCLTERERNVIISRFGLDNTSPMTLDEIGQMSNLSRERIRQIEAKALRKLRYAFARKKIKREDL
jgi:RNA polymerase primary sigma factor